MIREFKRRKEDCVGWRYLLPNAMHCESISVESDELFITTLGRRAPPLRHGNALTDVINITIRRISWRQKIRLFRN